MKNGRFKNIGIMFSVQKLEIDVLFKQQNKKKAKLRC